MAVDSTQSISENRQKYASYFKDSGNDTMNMDTFYQLLIAEMSNQDPMEPMSNTEFISQMASFTSLQTQSQALQFSTANYAQALVGQTVTVQGTDKLVTGVVDSTSKSGDNFLIKINGTDYDISKVQTIVGRQDASSSSVNAAEASYAAGLIGKQVTFSVESGGSSVVDYGVVQHVEINGAEIGLVIDGVSYPLSSVVMIEEAAKASDGDNDGETASETAVSDAASASETSVLDTAGSETAIADSAGGGTSLVDETGAEDEPDLVDDDEALRALFD